MFEDLEKINERPKPFEYYTADELWTNEHTSAKMLSFHLNEDIDVSSRKTEFIDRSVKWITSRFNIGRNKKVVDFGCGPGLYAIRLAQKKADVTGIDFSKRSIEYAIEAAAKEKLNIKYIFQNYLDFETKHKFDLIIMIMCDFCALSPDQRGSLLNKFNKILKSGGSILLDLYSLTTFDQKEERVEFEANMLNGFWSSNKYYGFLNTFKYEKEKVVLDKYTIIEKGQIRTVYNWLQHFSPEELEKEFEEAGFFIEGVYSDVAGTKYDQKSSEFAVVARRL